MNGTDQRRHTTQLAQMRERLRHMEVLVMQLVLNDNALMEKTARLERQILSLTLPKPPIVLEQAEPVEALVAVE